MSGPRSVRSILTETYRSALPTILLSGMGGLLAGSILGSMEAEIRAIEGLLVLVPAFLAIRGSVYGSLGSRLSTGLHQGLIDPAFERDNRLVSAVAAAILNGLFASVVAAILTYILLSWLGRPVAPIGTLLFVALVGGALAGVALTVVIVVVVFLGFRHGVNPDDLVGPAMTTAGDVFGMATLYLATRLAIVLL